tara:strand:- start:344 stop:505 length:162 start_codon:yes stop_codon:yes gene_type:complete
MASREKTDRKLLYRIALPHNDFAQLVHELTIGLLQAIDGLHIIVTQFLYVCDT